MPYAWRISTHKKYAGSVMPNTGPNTSGPMAWCYNECSVSTCAILSMIVLFGHFLVISKHANSQHTQGVSARFQCIFQPTALTNRAKTLCCNFHDMRRVRSDGKRSLQLVVHHVNLIHATRFCEFYSKQGLDRRSLGFVFATIREGWSQSLDLQQITLQTREI